MSTESGPRACFGVEKRDVPGVLRRAQAMHDSITAHPELFVSPTIGMVAFLALITALVLAQQQATATRARGTAALRNAKRNALWTAMGNLLSFVQGLAAGLDAANAAALIEAAGLVVAGTPRRYKEILTAQLTATPGTVHLDANASVLVAPADARKKRTFYWQASGDGGRTWTDLHASPYASTDVTGLALMTTYSFRVSVQVGKAAGAWSQPVSLLVH